MSSGRPVTDPVGYRSGSQKNKFDRTSGPIRFTDVTGPVHGFHQSGPVRFMDSTGPVRSGSWISPVRSGPVHRSHRSGPVRFTDFTVRSGPVSGSTGTIFSAVNRMTSLVLMFNLQNFQRGILFPFFAL